MEHVFCVFGLPDVIVSDNGPAFISELAAHTAQLFGFRHVPILPYNAQANGLAESAVKRIKTLLDRMTAGYTDWPAQLPYAQLLINAHKSHGTGRSPFEALFGREPRSVEQLEDPSLLPEVTGG